MIIDFHTHCFPDSVADNALKKLSIDGVMIPQYDGTPSGLISSMNSADIDYSVVQNIATNAKQTHSVNDFAISLVGSRLIPFGSVHPDAQDIEGELDRLKKAGVKGVKFHPEYQDFEVNDKKMYHIYEKIAKRDLIMLFHCGYDVMYSEPFRCTPETFAQVLDDFKGAKIVGAHLGGELMWDRVFKHILGRDVWLDIAMCFHFMSESEIKTVLDNHSPDRLLFATDAPWYNQKTAVNQTNAILKDYAEKDKIMYRNAAALLGLDLTEQI